MKLKKEIKPAIARQKLTREHIIQIVDWLQIFNDVEFAEIKVGFSDNSHIYYETAQTIDIQELSDY